MSGGEYDYIAISVEPGNISVIPASLRTPEIFHLNAKSPDALMVADRLRFPRRTRWRGPWAHGQRRPAPYSPSKPCQSSSVTTCSCGR